MKHHDKTLKFCVSPHNKRGGAIPQNRFCSIAISVSPADKKAPNPTFALYTRRRISYIAEHYTCGSPARHCG
jgi:hypothetical protein